MVIIKCGKLSIIKGERKRGDFKMRSRIFLCLLLIMAMLTFGACGDKEATGTDATKSNDTVKEDMDRAVDNAQHEMNKMDGKDMTTGGAIDDAGADAEK